MAAGDLIWVQSFRGPLPFRHYGIDMGDGTVIHLCGDNDEFDMRTMRVRRETRERFACDREVVVANVQDSLPAEQVIKSAEASLGESKYNLRSWNCEHFARKCKTGQAISHQVEDTESVAISGIQAAFKVAIGIASKRCTGRVAVRAITGTALRVGKISPAMFASDAAECAASWVATRAGYSAESKKSCVSAIGNSTAIAVGFLQGGPIGSTTMLALHIASKKAGEKIADSIRGRFDDNGTKVDSVSGK